MPKVEFRFLQVVTNPVSGDRATIALVHWDGTQVRVASSAAAIPKTATAAQVRALKKVIRGLGDAADQANAATDRHLLGLAEAFPVREGISSSIEWTRVRGGRTANPEKHFEELRALVRLDGKPERRRRMTQRKLHEELTQLGGELLKRFPDSVQVNLEVLGPMHRYRSPLSWKNGKWHHAVPFDMEDADDDRLATRVEAIVGKVRMAFDPKTDVPVVVAVLPADSARATAARGEADAIREMLREGAGEIVVDDRDDYIGTLLRTIERDVTHA